MQRILLLLIGALASSLGSAQLPNTQVYVFDMAIRDTTITFSNPLYLTGFNERGYNNQPGWVDRNTLLLSVQMRGETQPDVYKMDIGRQTKTRMTATPAGEYSPKVMAGGQKFSAIRQEYVGRDTVLRLWEFPMDLSDNGKPVFPNMNGTGYYEWLNSAQVALFLVENPSSLAMASTDADAPRELATRTGRCFARQPNGNLAYVDKSTSPWRILEQNLYRLDEAPALITETRPGSEDFSILPDGSYLMGQGSRIYRFDPIRTPRWVELTDLRLYGIKNISRITTNNFGRIAIVADGTTR